MEYKRQRISNCCCSVSPRNLINSIRKSFQLNSLYWSKFNFLQAKEFEELGSSDQLTLVLIKFRLSNLDCATNLWSGVIIYFCYTNSRCNYNCLLHSLLQCVTQSSPVVATWIWMPIAGAEPHINVFYSKQQLYSKEKTVCRGATLILFGLA